MTKLLLLEWNSIPVIQTGRYSKELNQSNINNLLRLALLPIENLT
jgi:hypothetical protein